MDLKQRITDALNEMMAPDGMVAAPEAVEVFVQIAREAQAEQRQADAAKARGYARGWQMNTDVAVKIAEAIEQEDGQL